MMGRGVGGDGHGDRGGGRGYLDFGSDECYTCVSGGCAVTKTIDAIYEHGTLRLQRRLPLRERTHVTLTLSLPSTPVSRTRGIIRVAPRTARAIIYGDDFDLYGA